MRYQDDTESGFMPMRHSSRRKDSSDGVYDGGYRTAQENSRAMRGATRSTHAPDRDTPSFPREVAHQVPGNRPGFWTDDWEVDSANWKAIHKSSGLVSILENRNDGTMTVTIEGFNALDPEKHHMNKLFGECFRIWQRPPRRTPR